MRRLRRTACWLNYLASLVIGSNPSVLGLYGLTAYHTARRTAEIGVRMALGAHRRDVVCMILKSSMLLVLAGAAAGIAATLPLMRLVTSLLFGVHPLTL